MPELVQTIKDRNELINSLIEQNDVPVATPTPVATPAPSGGIANLLARLLGLK